MIDLELRRHALEASGIPYGTRLDCCPEYGDEGFDGPCYWVKGLPWEFDEDHPLNPLGVECNPAASEPWFLEWCEKNDANFELRDYFADVTQTTRYFIVTVWLKNGLVHQARGTSPSEARARAVIAASKGGQR